MKLVMRTNHVSQPLLFIRCETVNISQPFSGDNLSFFLLIFRQRISMLQYRYRTTNVV